MTVAYRLQLFVLALLLAGCDLPPPCGFGVVYQSTIICVERSAR